MSETIRYRGRFAQTGIYLGKLFRMFIYQNDWKVLPMAALIAGMVTFAVGTNIFKTQEGTLSGCFALVCVCIWNGSFNSIQVVCRERATVKREHRAGMHITSYIAAHMIYQLLLCAAQTAITIGICQVANISFPKQGLITGNCMFDIGIGLFLITYSSDILSLAISSLVKSTTTAMTIMPFMMMFQLVFSGGLIVLEGAAANLTDLTIAKWGLCMLCALGGYNSQPMVTLWNTIWKFRSMTIDGTQPVKIFTDMVLKNKMRDEILQESGLYNQNPLYASELANVMTCVRNILIMTLLFAVISVLLLKRIDKDKR